MNINQVAKALVELRESSMSPLFYTGDLREKLGEEGLAEALRLRWMLPDEHSGLLQITNSPGVLGEMRTLAETCVKDGKDQCDGKADEEGDDKKEKKGKKPDFLAKLGLRKEVPESYSDASRGLALGHHNRQHIVEIMAPSQMRPLYTSSAPSAPTGAPDEELGVGDDVFCTENGQSYSAKVASVDKDGKMSLSFGDKKPGGNRTAYDRKDLKLAKKLDTSRLAA